MSNLQQSFSEISRLADDTALPELEEKEQEAERWNREVERLSLMILADGMWCKVDRNLPRTDHWQTMTGSSFALTAYGMSWKLPQPETNLLGTPSPSTSRPWRRETDLTALNCIHPTHRQEAVYDTLHW